MSYKKINLLDWPENLLIGNIYSEIRKVSSLDIEFPLAVRLMENPKFTIWGGNLALFPGAVDGTKHDYIHILLGRSFLPLDEAFVVGFCMGSSKTMTPFKIWLFRTLASTFYPKFYRFSNVEKEVFSKAVALGTSQAKYNLSKISKTNFAKLTVGQARAQLIYDWNVILKFYEVEANDYASYPSSRRLAKYLQRLNFKHDQ